MSVQHYDAFKADIRTINRKFRKRTSSLRGLLDHLKATRDRPVLIPSVDAALGHCRRPADRRIEKYRPAVERVVSVWGTPERYPEELQAARGGGGGSPRALVNSAKRELDRMKGYASGDALSFLNCINPRKRAEIEAKARACLNDVGMQVGGIGAAVAGLGSPVWKAGMLRQSYQTVTRTKAGVCTTFAHTAAHILKAKPIVARIEIVSYRNHVFVIVGRDGGYEPGVGRSRKLPHHNAWRGDWYIVDGWAGAMGFEVVYSKTRNYPFMGMMSPLKLVMASDFEEDDG